MFLLLNIGLIFQTPQYYILHLGSSSIRVFTNNSNLLGGESNSFILHKTDLNFSFHGRLDNPPICFSTKTTNLPDGCLPLNYRSLLTDSPNGNPKTRDLWVLNLQYIGSSNYKDTVVHDNPPTSIPLCEALLGDLNGAWNNVDRFKGFPLWHECMFQSKGLQFSPHNSHLSIFDFSIPSPDYDYREYLNNQSIRYYWNDNLIIKPEKVNRWFLLGWVSPIFITKSHNGTHIS